MPYAVPPLLTSKAGWPAMPSSAACRRWSRPSAGTTTVIRIVLHRPHITKLSCTYSCQKENPRNSSDEFNGPPNHCAMVGNSLEITKPRPTVRSVAASAATAAGLLPHCCVAPSCVTPSSSVLWAWCIMRYLVSCRCPLLISLLAQFQTAAPPPRPEKAPVVLRLCKSFVTHSPGLQ